MKNELCRIVWEVFIQHRDRHQRKFPLGSVLIYRYLCLLHLNRSWGLLFSIVLVSDPVCLGPGFAHCESPDFVKTKFYMITFSVIKILNSDEGFDGLIKNLGRRSEMTTSGELL